MNIIMYPGMFMLSTLLMQSERP